MKHIADPEYDALGQEIMRHAQAQTRANKPVDYDTCGINNEAARLNAQTAVRNSTLAGAGTYPGDCSYPGRSGYVQVMGMPPPPSLKPSLTPTWQITSVPDGMSGRGDVACSERQRLCAAGWEPFAVSGGRVWFRYQG